MKIIILNCLSFILFALYAICMTCKLLFDFLAEGLFDLVEKIEDWKGL